MKFLFPKIKLNALTFRIFVLNFASVGTWSLCITKFLACIIKCIQRKSYVKFQTLAQPRKTFAGRFLHPWIPKNSISLKHHGVGQATVHRLKNVWPLYLDIIIFDTKRLYLNRVSQDLVSTFFKTDFLHLHLVWNIHVYTVFRDFLSQSTKNSSASFDISEPSLEDHCSVIS